MGVWSCQGLYGGVVMSRTVWGCGHVKDCMGVWLCQGCVVMSRADRNVYGQYMAMDCLFFVLEKNPFNNTRAMLQHSKACKRANVKSIFQLYKAKPINIPVSHLPPHLFY